MKKILFLIESPTMGGAEKVLVDIVNTLDSEKFQPTVCSLFKKSVYGYRYPYEVKMPFNDTVHYNYLFNNGNRWMALLANFVLSKFPAHLYRYFLHDKYDVAVAFSEGAPTRLLSAAKLKHGKKIAWLHTSTELSQKGKTGESLRQEQERYGKFDKIVAVSDFVAKSFSALFPALADRVVVAYNPIDVDGIRRKSSVSAPFRRGPEHLLVSVGRITGAKAYDRYLRVIRDLTAKGFVFQVWIVGGGDRSQLELYCRENNLNNVSFFGNQSNPYPLIRMADWVVIPSQIEGLPTVVLESLSLGKAILATNCGGTREILGDSEYGLLVGNDEQSLADGLSSVLTGQADRIQFEEAALRRCSFFTKEARIPIIEGFLK